MDTLWRILTWVTLNPDSAAGLAGMVAALVGLFRRWAVANRRDSLAALSGWASRAAGEVATMLAKTPPGMKPGDFAARLLRERAERAIVEFDKTAPLVGATPDKLAGMAMGELGKILGPQAPTLQVPSAPPARPVERQAI